MKELSWYFIRSRFAPFCSSNSSSGKTSYNIFGVCPWNKNWITTLGSQPVFWFIPRGEWWGWGQGSVKATEDLSHKTHSSMELAFCTQAKSCCTREKEKKKENQSENHRIVRNKVKISFYAVQRTHLWIQPQTVTLSPFWPIKSTAQEVSFFVAQVK